MSDLHEYRLKQPPADANQAEEIKQIGAHVIAQAKALRAECANLTLRLQAGTEAARQVVAFADANAAEHQRQRELMNAAWDSGISVLEQIQRERELIEDHVAQAARLAQAPAFPGANPGAVPAVPGALYPAGPTPFSFLYQQLQAIDLTSGGAASGTLAINTSPANNLTFDSRYAWSTDNTGSPPHTVTGPNLYLTDTTVSKVRIKFNSLGEVAFFISDPSLVNNGVSHTIQLWGMNANGTAQPGFGTGVQIFLSDAAGVGQEAGNFQCWLTNTSAGSISSAVQILNRVAGAGQAMLYMDPSGEVRVAAPAGFLTVPVAPAAVTGHANVLSGPAGFVGGAGGTHFGANNAAADFSRSFLDFQVNGASVAKITAPGQYVLNYLDNANSSVSFSMRLGHQLTTGNAAAGFGSGMQFYGADSTNAAVQLGASYYIQSNATPSGVTADWVLQAILSGTVTQVAQTNDLGDFKSSFRVLAVGGIGVGNSASATTPGSVVKKFQVFDAAGNSLGFVPIYSAIT